MSDLTLQLNNPITEEQWDAITDVDFEHTKSIEFTTKHGKKVTFYKELPSAQPEPLTDKEQRIFLAAMGREEKVCKEVDEEYTREPYEDSLVRVCREIERKVKKTLWTN